VKPHAVERAENLLGAEALEWRPVGGGYTPAERWLVRSAEGRTAFVKAAVNEDTAEWLRREHVVYSNVRAGFLPELLGWDDAPRPVLLLEDLSDAFWPPPWSRNGVALVRAALADIAATTPPAGVGRLEDQRSRFDGWRDIDAEPGPFLSLGLCSRGWLESSLPILIAASDAAVLDGDELLHLDVRSDNICFRGDRAVLVDWNEATVGNAALALAFWLPSLALEGGPAPDEVGRGVPGIAELACITAAYFAARAGLPPLPLAPGVRPLQLAQLRVALPWTARELELPPLDR
jgi:hypothetical protein